MSLSILLMFLYQARFGALYLHIGLISSLFMLGSCVGGQLVERTIRAIEAWCEPGGRLRAVEQRVERGAFSRSVLRFLTIRPGSKQPAGANVGRLVLVCVSFHLAFLLLVALIPNLLPRWGYGLLFIGCGLFVGVYFPLVALQHRRATHGSARSGAVLESLDHVGGAVGAVLTGWILIPVLGTTETLIVLGLTVAVNLAPWWFSHRPTLESLVADPFDRWVRPVGFFLFGLGIIAVVTSNLCAFATPNRDRQLLVAAAREMMAGETLQEKRATLKDGTPWSYFVAPSGEIVFSTDSLCGDVYGYGGPINLALHMTGDGTLRDVRVLRSNETPVYLENLYLGWWSTLMDRNMFEPDPFGEVDAVSGSTMTSQAVLRILESAGTRFAVEVEGRPFRSAEHTPRVFVPDREFICLGALFIIAAAVRTRPGTWRRRGILLVSLLLTGVLLNIQYSTQHAFALTSGRVSGNWLSGSFFLVVCVPLLVVMLGNVYCGYVCPFGALQELLGDLRPSRWKTDPSLLVWRYGRAVKYLLLLLVVLLFAWTRDFTVLSADPLIRLFGAMRDAPVLSLAGTVLILSFVYPRFWCRNLCPAGAFLALVSGLRPFRKLLPATRPTRCDMGVRVTTELDCLCCDRCRHAKE
jgi:hypothetical protein